MNENVKKMVPRTTSINRVHKYQQEQQKKETKEADKNYICRYSQK